MNVTGVVRYDDDRGDELDDRDVWRPENWGHVDEDDDDDVDTSGRGNKPGRKPKRRKGDEWR